MGLKEAVQQAAKAAFGGLGNLTSPATYRKNSPATYNATTGAVTRSETSVTVSGVVMAFERREIDGLNIRPTDQRFLVLAETLGAAPTIDDRVTIAGINWEVVTIRTDPATAVYDLHIRRL